MLNFLLINYQKKCLKSAINIFNHIDKIIQENFEERYLDVN